jgi:hypothetical protein
MFGSGGVEVNGYYGDSQPYVSRGVRMNAAWQMSVHGMHFASNWAGVRIDANASGGSSFDFRNDGYAYCPGGTWISTSDARIKDVLGDYTNGLDAIAALHPVRFKYKGNNTYEAPDHFHTGTSDEVKAKNPAPKSAPVAPYKNSPHFAFADKELIGLLAQEAEVSMPELVMRSKGHIDGVAVDDLRDMNTTPLFFALINAVKELKARVEELEAKLA